MASASLHALLSGLIDYAGLFPPAGLPLDEVVHNYGTYRRSKVNWALGRLVVPAARLRQLVSLLQASGNRWPVTALVGEDLVADVASIAAVSNSADIVVESAEVRATTVAQVNAAVSALAGVRDVYVELPPNVDLPSLLTAVSDAGARAKIRTGAIVADGIPSAADVARFLEVCAAKSLPFKATAGLHHPLRGDYPLTYAADAPRGHMFGFLNVFAGAAYARAGMRGEVLEQLLAESGARNFHFSHTGLTWRGASLSIDDLLDARTSFAMSFGSCSFREPIDELIQLGLLSP